MNDPSGNKRILVAIMFTDMVGYTALMQKDEILARRKRARHRKVFKQLHQKYNGQIIQYFGDGTLSIFQSTLEATRCSIELQIQLQKPIEVPLRIGIHVGEVIVEEDGLLGDAVNLASRVESFATPGSVFVSNAVVEQLKNQKQLVFQSMGRFQLKNVEKSWELFAVMHEGVFVPKPSELKGKGKRLSPPKKKALDEPTLSLANEVNFGKITDSQYPKYLSRIPDIDMEKECLGRKADILTLKHKLEHSTKAVLLNGLGGIGKTTLAAAYIKEFGKEYDHLVWIDQGEDLIDTIALNEDLADTLRIPFKQEEELKVRFHHICRKLHYLPGKNLLVIDNAQEQITQKEVYDDLPGLPNWHVLLTSRLVLSGFEHMRLATLAPEKAQKLFRIYYKAQYIENDLTALLQEIGYHTLTVELLAKLLDRLNNIISVAQLNDILRQKQLDDPNLQEKVWTRHSREEWGIYTHLLKAFELMRLSERENWLLKQFTVLPVERYNVAILVDFLKKKPLELNKMLNSLASKGWLTRHEDKTFSIHRVIRQAALYQLQPVFEDIKTLVNSMIQKTNVDAYTNRITNTASWITHATTIENFLKEEKHKQIAVLQNNIAITYDALGQYEKALIYHKRALAIKESVLNPQSLDLGLSYNNIALAYRALGQYKNAFECQKKVLAIHESVLDAKHPKLATSYNNFAGIFSAIGQYDKALKYYKKSLTIRKQVLEPNHPDLAQSFTNIGKIYRVLGHYEEALICQKKALTIKEAVLDPLHPDLAISYNNIALVFRDIMRYEDGFRYHKKALSIFEVVLEPNHPYIAVIFNNMGLSHHATGQHEEAINCYKKAIVILETALGLHHPHLAKSYYNIAEVLSDIKQFEDALGYHKKSLFIRESILDAHHPDLTLSYDKIAKTYRALGQHKKAEEYQLKADSIKEEE